MRFTEELRARAREHQVLVGGLGLEKVADRIDERWEQEESDFDLMTNKIAAQATCLVEVGEALGVSADQPDSEFYWELAEAARGSIQLPKDADGVPIHLQDRVRWNNCTFDVHELKLTADGWTTWDELHGYTVRADQCHHVKPDSWERIISEFAERVLRSGHQWGLDAPAATAEFVERCKRLAGEDA